MYLVVTSNVASYLLSLGLTLGFMFKKFTASIVKYFLFQGVIYLLLLPFESEPWIFYNSKLVYWLFSAIHNYMFYWWALEKHKVPTKYIALIKDMYKDATMFVRTCDGNTSDFSINIGLHQGALIYLL